MYITKNLIANALNISDIGNAYLKNTTKEQAAEKIAELQKKISERIEAILNQEATKNWYLKRGKDIFCISALKKIVTPYVLEITGNPKTTYKNITAAKLSLLTREQKNEIIETYMRNVEEETEQYTKHLKYLS